MKTKNIEKILLSIILGSFFIVFCTIALNRFWQYATWYYDFGIFYRAISAVAQGQAPIVDHFVFTDKNILADHFHPIIFLVSPFVAIFKRGEVLLIFQSLFVTLSGFFGYLTAKEILLQNSKNNKVKINFVIVQSFCLLLIYLFFYGLHTALITEFHEITLLPLPLMMFFYGMTKKNKLWYFVGLLGVLVTKESTFIIPAWFGVLVFIQNKNVWRKIGAITTVFSILYGVLLIKLVFPLFSEEGYSYISGTFNNNNLDEIFINLFTKVKITTVIETFTSFGFLPLLAPEMLPPVLFNWWSRFSSIATTRHNLGMHYNAEIAPTLFLATTYGWIRFKKLFEFILTKLKNLKLDFKLKTVFLNKLICVILVVLTSGCIFFSLWILKSPLLLFTNKAFYIHTQNFKFLDDLIAHIPEDGVVMAQTNIAAKIAYRKVYMLRQNYYEFKPDYIVIDTRDGQEPNNFFGVGDFVTLVEKIKLDPNYEIFYDQGEQLIYKRIK